MLLVHFPCVASFVSCAFSLCGQFSWLCSLVVVWLINLVTWLCLVPLLCIGMMTFLWFDYSQWRMNWESDLPRSFLLAWWLFSNLITLGDDWAEEVTRPVALGWLWLVLLGWLWRVLFLSDEYVLQLLLSSVVGWYGPFIVNLVPWLCVGFMAFCDF